MHAAMEGEKIAEKKRHLKATKARKRKEAELLLTMQDALIPGFSVLQPPLDRPRSALTHNALPALAEPRTLPTLAEPLTLPTLPEPRTLPTLPEPSVVVRMGSMRIDKP